MVEQEVSIGSGQYSILMVLAEQNGLMQDRISSALQMDKATVTRALPTIRKVLSDWNELVSTGLSQTEKHMVLNILQKMAENVGHK